MKTLNKAGIFALSLVFLTACNSATETGHSESAQTESGQIESIQTGLDQTESQKPMSTTSGLYAHFNTTKGKITVKLEFEKAPMTVANFVGLIKGEVKNTAKELGTPYYDGLSFHRVIPNFMIQGGDPQGNGSGGPGYKFADEIDPTLVHNRAGTLSMANAGPATNGSQFFITHGATDWLDGKHTVFGYVTEGQDVVNAIAQGDKMETVTVEAIGDAAAAFDATAVLAEYASKFRAG